MFAVPRTSNSYYNESMEESQVTERVQDLVGVLKGIDIHLDVREAKTPVGKGRFDAAIVVNGKRMLVDVKRDVREGDAHALVARMPAHFVVVADRLSPGAKRILETHHSGWLDLRGDLRLELPPGILIRTDFPPLVTPDRARAGNLFTGAGLDVAIALLLDPADPPGVRGIARRTGVSPGRVSELLKGLRMEGLIDRDGTPAIPDLFDATAAAWNPQWVPLGQAPRPDSDLRLSGSLGAIWHGIALAVTEDWPPEIYVRNEFALRRLVQSYPPDLARTIYPLARVAVCPSLYGFDEVADMNPQFPVANYPVANYIVVALDLAQDQGRGREALDGWSPEGVVRVW